MLCDKARLSPRGVESGGEGKSELKWRRWSKVFAGFEIFDSGIILGGSSWEEIFWGDIQNNLKIRGSARLSRPHWG